MSRIFRRGELRAAVLVTVAEVEPANGYAIMQALEGAVGGGWRPSPGAIYPALLGLEDAGLIVGEADGEGSTTYRLTERGRTEAAREGSVVAEVADRARAAPPAPTVGELLDAFTADVGSRSRRLEPPTADAVRSLLSDTATQLSQLLEEDPSDG